MQKMHTLIYDEERVEMETRLHDLESLLKILEGVDQTPIVEDRAPELFDIELKGQVDALLQTLDARELAVIQQHFGLDGSAPLSLEELGARLGLDETAVDELRVQALNKLREPGRYQIMASLMQESRSA
tara:strand:- start:1584 stop:1970 length:387 start_codon:yes stop_codon:yes gene_type:complete